MILLVLLNFECQKGGGDHCTGYLPRYSGRMKVTFTEKILVGRYTAGGEGWEGWEGGLRDNGKLAVNWDES